jgi:hypothetical protein
MEDTHDDEGETLPCRWKIKNTSAEEGHALLVA